MCVVFMKDFLLSDSRDLLAVTLIFCLLSPKTFHSYLIDMIYVVFMKNFHLACSNKLMAFRLISAF